MTVASLLDLGASREKLDKAIESLNLEGFHYHIERKHSYIIAGLDFDVHLHHHHDEPHEEHHHGHHIHGSSELKDKNITVWVLFIIFVLGPCEALLPILTASSVMGIPAVISSTIIFSIATITTMLAAVCLGYYGLEALRFKKLEAYAHELAGATVMACGIAILCGL